MIRCRCATRGSRCVVLLSLRVKQGGGKLLLTRFLMQVSSQWFVYFLQVALHNRAVVRAVEGSFPAPVCRRNGEKCALFLIFAFFFRYALPLCFRTVTVLAYEVVQNDADKVRLRRLILPFLLLFP
jgi:hypothetical protein